MSGLLKQALRRAAAQGRDRSDPPVEPAAPADDWRVAPACGKGVVVKPSEATQLGEAMNEVGVPPGSSNVANGFGPDGACAFLTAHPGADAISFTREIRSGPVIMRACANS